MSKHLFIAKSRRTAPIRKKAGATPGTSLYQSVMARIVEALERGVIPWRRPWRGPASLPCNAVSKRPYHGINLLLLSLAPFRDHRWLTFRQAQELGAYVRPRERSTIAIFWKHWEIKQPEDEQDCRRRRTIPLLRFYHLFNADQCEGLSLPSPDEHVDLPSAKRIEQAEELVRSMQNPPRII